MSTLQHPTYSQEMDDLSSVQSVLPREKSGTTAAAAAVGSHSTSSDSEPSWEWCRCTALCINIIIFCIAMLEMATLSLYVHYCSHQYSLLHSYLWCSFVVLLLSCGMAFFTPLAIREKWAQKRIRVQFHITTEERSFPFQNLAHIFPEWKTWVQG